MQIKTFSKKYIFVFLLFCVQEIFMNLIGEYSKTFLAKSITNGKYIFDMLWTLVLYSVVVFVAAFVIFLMIFKEQSLLYSFKKKLLGFVGVTAAYEIVKLIAYLIAKDKTQSVYFILGNIYLFAVQIVIFRLFSDIDAHNGEQKLNIGKKQLIASAVLIIAAAVFVIISENSVRNSSNELYKSGFAFACGFRLAIVTALIQTVLFGGLMNSELPEKVTVKREFIIFDAIVGVAAILFFAKWLLPEGMFAGWRGFIMEAAGKVDGEFGTNYSETEIYRMCAHDKQTIYYSKTTQVYYGKDKVCTYSRIDPEKTGEEFYFENSDYSGMLEKDSMIVYRTKSGNIEYCCFGDKQSNDYDKEVYDLVLKCAQTKSGMRFYSDDHSEVEGLSNKLINMKQR